MRRLYCLSILTPLTLLAAAPVCRAMDGRASAEISVLDDRDRARVDVIESKLKLKMLEIEDAASGNDGNSNAGINCGAVNIGNNGSNNTGTGRVAPHDTTVIVTGDVFNTATCGR